MQIPTKEKYQEVFLMAGAIMNKVWDLFGMDTERETEEIDEKTMRWLELSELA